MIAKNQESTIRIITRLRSIIETDRTLTQDEKLCLYLAVNDLELIPNLKEVLHAYTSTMADNSNG